MMIAARLISCLSLVILVTRTKMGIPTYVKVCNEIQLEGVKLVLLGLYVDLPIGCIHDLTQLFFKVFCLEHRSYNRHHCPTANKNDVTVVVCPLCAKGVRLFPDEDPNITWESHVNTECDPSNYEKATKKRKCPVPRCREILTFSNTIKCRVCTVDHCLKHRFGPDHSCPGQKKPESVFQFMNFRTGSRKDEPKKAPATSSSSWATTLFKAAEAGMAKLSSKFNQTLQMGNEGRGQSSSATNRSASASGQVEQCPQCTLKFSSVTALVNHVQKVHEKNGVMNLTIDVCPRCSKGFRDPVSLVEHVEREHKGTSMA